MDADNTKLETRNLCVSYNKKLTLASINLKAKHAKVLAIVGPSGCGKSTFLACINRLHDLNPDCKVEGSILLDGQEVMRPGIDLLRLRRRIGLITQRPNPLPLSIGRNITFPLRHHGIIQRSARQEAATQALMRVGLWDEVKDRLDKPASELSGGQQQRLCLARALALQPGVLLLDEPCSALDPLATAIVEELVASLSKEITVVIVTHNLAQARRLADEVAVFWSKRGVGYLEETGKSEQIFNSPRSEITSAYLNGEIG